MNKNGRHFHKNDNSKNFFGEQDYVEVQNGQVSLNDIDSAEDPPPQESKSDGEGG